MLSTTNNTKKFFEEGTEQIIIYGAGNAGYWIGYYMVRCEIDFLLYIDKDVKHQGAKLNGRPVYCPEKLSEYRGQPLRIVISPNVYKSVLWDVMRYAQKFEINVLCLVPEYKHIVSGKEIYNINKLLAYFRHKLYQGDDVPTIISYECTGGQIYDSMNWILNSPTVNATYTYEDYIKLCQDPQKYFSYDISNVEWKIFFNNNGTQREFPCGRLLDIDVWFAHTDTCEGCAERWNIMRRNINWNNMIFLIGYQKKIIFSN